MIHSRYLLWLSVVMGWNLVAVVHAGDDTRPNPDDCLYQICWKEKYGFIDRSGKVVVQVKYDDVTAYGSSTGHSPDLIARRSYSDGLRPVKLGEKWGYIDANETFVIPRKFDHAGPFSNGHAQVCQDEKWGMIDRTGKIVIEPRYSYIASFKHGWAPVAVGGDRLECGLPGGKWGLIDSTGKVILEPKYEMVHQFGKSVALVNVGGRWTGGGGLQFCGGKWGVADRQGKFIIEPSFALPNNAELERPPTGNAEGWEQPSLLLFAAGLAPIAIDGKWGYLDEHWRIAVKPQFDWAGPFAVPPFETEYWSSHDYGSGGIECKATAVTALARAQLKGKLGFIDRTGAWIIKPIYDSVGHFSGGLAWVRQGDRFAYINEKGVEAFTVAKGEEGTPFWHELAAVRVGKLWGYVDKAGKWVHQPQFDEIRHRNDDLQEVRKNRKAGLIDRTGQLVCPLKYDWFGSFQPSGLALVGIGPTGDGADIGLIDKTGRVILEPASGREFGIVYAMYKTEQKIFPRWRNDRWGFVDSDGKFVIEPQYESYKALGEGMVAVREKQQDGLVDLRAGQLVCPPKYYSIHQFSEGLAEVRPKFGGKIGFVDRTGKVVIPPTWDAVYRFRDGVAGVTFYGSTIRPQTLWIDRSGKYLWKPPD